MRLKYLYLIFIFLNCLQALAEEISFESNMLVKKGDQNNYEQLKAGDKIQLSQGESLMAFSSQNVPLLIYSTSSKTSQIRILDTNLSVAMVQLLQPQLQKSTNEILDVVRKVESLIQKRDYTQASQLIVPLREKYKDVSSVLFLSGTVRYLMNDKAQAIDDLQKGLAIDPNDENAKKLLAKLKGGGA